MSNKKEQHKIEWFEKLRLNSWEVEILIVGFVLVMMLQIPNYLIALNEKMWLAFPLEDAEVAMSFFAKTLIILSLEACIYFLILSFTIYLALRGFWIGLIGFSSVFPDGINVKQLNFNKIFTNQIKKYNFNDFIITIDHICSSIFSFSFLITFSFLSFIIYIVQILFIVAFKKTILLDNDSSFVLPFNILFHWPHLILGFIYFIDFFFFSLLKKIKWNFFGVIYNYVNIFFKYTTLVFIYEPLYYAIISNVKRRIIFISLIGLVLFGSLTEYLTETEYPETYFPSDSQSSENIMLNLSYENQFSDIDDHHVFPDVPFINSDIIENNYLRLYIPYFAETNTFYKKLCDSIDYISSEDPDSKKVQEVLDCMNLAYKITIDDKEIESNFIFYSYSKLGVDMKTLFMPITIKHLDDGQHTIVISEMFSRNINVEIDDEVVALQIVADGDNKSYSIPFYIFRD